MFWVFTGNGGYLDASGIWGYVASLGARQTGWFLFGQAALVALAVVSVRRWRDHVDLWLWLASGVVAVVAGLRFFPHYYLQLLPPLVLLAVAGIDAVPVRARRGVAIAATVVAVATCSYFLVPAFRGSDTRDTMIALAAGRYLAAHTTADQRVLVWGQAPEAYWIADRRPATRFATTGFVTGTSGGRPPWRVGTRYAVPGAWDDFLARPRTPPARTDREHVDGPPAQRPVLPAGQVPAVRPLPRARRLARRRARRRCRDPRTPGERRRARRRPARQGRVREHVEPARSPS